MLDIPRLELLVAERGRAVVVALAVVGVLALTVAGWIALTPPTSTVVQEVDEQRVDAAVATSAVVTDDDSIWEQGTRIEDSPVYLTNASPTLTVEPRTTVPADGPVTVGHELSLRIEAVRDGEAFWSTTEPLLAESATVEDGEFASSTEIHVPSTRERLRDVADRLSGVGSVRASLHLTVAYDTGRYEGTLSAGVPLQVTDDAYWLDGSLAAGETRTTTVTSEVTQPPNWGAALALSVVGLVALTCAAAVRSRRIDAIDPEQVRERLHRRRYDEWISPGTLPMGVGKDYVELESLEDVVDVAIDVGHRVIHDCRRDLFAVINGDVIYYYSREGDWSRVSWPAVDVSPGGDDGASRADAGSDSGAEPSGDASGPGDESPGTGGDPLEEWVGDLPDDADDAWDQL